MLVCWSTLSSPSYVSILPSSQNRLPQCQRAHTWSACRQFVEIYQEIWWWERELCVIRCPSSMLQSRWMLPPLTPLSCPPVHIWITIAGGDGVWHQPGWSVLTVQLRINNFQAFKSVIQGSYWSQCCDIGADRSINSCTFYYHFMSQAAIIMAASLQAWGLQLISILIVPYVRCFTALCNKMAAVDSQGCDQCLWLHKCLLSSFCLYSVLFNVVFLLFSRKYHVSGR